MWRCTHARACARARSSVCMAHCLPCSSDSEGYEVALLCLDNCTHLLGFRPPMAPCKPDSTVQSYQLLTAPSNSACDIQILQGSVLLSCHLTEPAAASARFWKFGYFPGALIVISGLEPGRARRAEGRRNLSTEILLKLDWNHWPVAMGSCRELELTFRGATWAGAGEGSRTQLASSGPSERGSQWRTMSKRRVERLVVDKVCIGKSQ